MLLVILVAAVIAGWLVDMAAGPMGRILAGAVLGLVSVVIVLTGWSAEALLEAAAAILGFNAVLLLRALQRRRTAKREAALEDSVRPVR